eukprot:412319-Rhodomonas_salina.1
MFPAELRPCLTERGCTRAGIGLNLVMVTGWDLLQQATAGRSTQLFASENADVNPKDNARRRVLHARSSCCTTPELRFRREEREGSSPTHDLATSTAGIGCETTANIIILFYTPRGTSRGVMPWRCLGHEQQKFLLL